MSNVRLPPLTEAIGSLVLHHGERGRERDPAHPLACLCGAPFYLHCEGYVSEEDEFLSTTIYPAGPQAVTP